MNLFNLFKKPMYLVHYKYKSRRGAISGYGSLVVKGGLTCQRIVEIKEGAESNLRHDNNDEFTFNVVIVNICKIR